MQQVRSTSAWKTLGPMVLGVLVLAAVGVWAKSIMVTSPSASATVGAAVPAEASAIAPIEMMITHGRELPAADYAEPF